MNIYQHATHGEQPSGTSRLNPPQSVFSRPCGLILLGATLLAAMPTPSSALTLVVNNDTMVDSVAPLAKYGALGTLGIKNEGSTQRTFAKFDLAVLPLAAVISRATLRIFVNKVSKPGKLTVNTVSADWSEGTLTDNNQLALVPLTNQSAAATLAIEPTDEKHYINYDITALVQDWQTNPQSNFGIALTPPADGTPVNVALDSKESIGTSHPMEIELAFEGPKGAKGDQGDPGIKGAKGDTGATGPQGAAGPQGQAGADGKDGAPGPQGLPGSSGAIGPQGIPGVQGVRGGSGPKGLPGNNGISGYEINVVEGTLGSAFDGAKGLFAACTGTKKVIHGGCAAKATSNTAIYFVSSTPAEKNNGYSCFFRTGDINETIYAYAICANAIE